jgi:hypothetical protein
VSATTGTVGEVEADLDTALDAAEGVAGVVSPGSAAAISAIKTVVDELETVFASSVAKIRQLIAAHQLPQVDAEIAQMIADDAALQKVGK